MDSFPGHHLRCAVGGSSVILGFSAMTISEWDWFFVTAKNDAPNSKRDYERQMRECAEACSTLCNDIDAVNDLLVCLTSSAYALQSFREGDDSRTDPTALIRPLYV